MVNLRYVGSDPSVPDSIARKKDIVVADATDTVKGVMKLPGYDITIDPGSPEEPFYTYGLVGGTADAPHVMYVTYLVKAFSEWGSQLFNEVSTATWEVKREALDASTDATLALADNSVQKTGNETVAGTKTFSSNPIVPTPTQPTHASTKTYVDGRIDSRVQNTPGQALILWTGTQAAYDALPIKDAATVYIIT
ncbi:hypothetical protein SEA_NICEHOUSE_196 [Rhodococcus phage NiceHouse]|nr:hypothetical protein SEA_NICEHOUSE_196 [Rhodococcus phage NiceHouse]